MKILFCSDVQMGTACTENIDVKQSHKWQVARSQKLADLFDNATQNNATYVALVGQIFGQDRISESVIDDLFDCAKHEAGVQILLFFNEREFNRISYRNDIPENIHILSMENEASFTDPSISIRTNNGAAELQIGNNETFVIRKNESEQYLIDGTDKEYMIPSFEPIGFEDAEKCSFGYGIFDYSEGSPASFTIKPDQKYAFRTAEVRILAGDDEKEILRKINDSVRNMDHDTFLRITLTGSTAFGMTINGGALKKQLQNKLFFVEVYDNTVMDVDMETFENDISLRSEFVRLAMEDDSLSISERNRLISCGWNALNSKEASGK